MKAVIYSRVSTEEQKKQGYSLHEQEKRLRDYCLHNSYEVIVHYQDDHSAKDFKRPQYQKFLSDLSEKKINPEIFLVTKADRFGRDVFKVYAEIDRLNSLGIKVASVSEGFFDFKNPNKFFQNLIQFGAAHHENILKADNTIRGMRQALRQGKWVWNAPIGYSNHKIKSLVPNEKASIVRDAFELMSTGLYSADEVRKRLLCKGLKVAKQIFLNMLRNRLYCGEIQIKEWQNEPFEIVKGIHEPIISKELFQRVQEILTLRKKNWPKVHSANENLPLRGFLICNICGGNLTGSGSKSRNKSVHHYYHCQNGCKERFRADTANQLLIEYINQLEVPPEIINLYTTILQDVFSQDEFETKKRLINLENVIAQTKKRIQSLTDNYLDGNINQHDYNESNIRYKNALEELTAEHWELSSNKTSFEKYIRYGISILPDVSKYYKLSDLTAKKQIIGSIFPEKLIFDGKRYRTNRINSLFTLIPATVKGLKKDEIKKAGIISGFLKVAPPSGLEPETP